MKLEYKTGRSSSYPKLIDDTSSKFVTYVRKNVREIEVPDYHHNKNGEEDAEPKMRIEYEYDEARPTKEEYKLYQEFLAAENADTDSQLAIAELAELIDTQNTTIELALAELAEAITSNNE